jgi:solute carrier family 25 (mitochondrial 2-oxodicarboxylate transporter), member 21
MTDGKILAMATGVSAGMTEAVIVSTPDLIKIRMQDKRNAGMYGGPMDVVKKIMATEGYLKLTKNLRTRTWN